MFSFNVDPSNENSYDDFKRGINAERLIETHGYIKKLCQLNTITQLSDLIEHDFNNQIQIIMSAIRIIQKRKNLGSAGDISFILSNATQAADRATALTQCLLAAVAPQEKGSQSLSINDFLQTQANSIRQAIGHRIELRLMLSEVDAIVGCNRDQFENAIINLVLNSRNSMPNGGIITIETAPADLEIRHPDLPNGPYLAISVYDTGCGMKQEFAYHAHERFVTNSLRNGRGLGLPSVKAFVRQNNGYFELNSTVGQGTCARIYLPVSRHR